MRVTHVPARLVVVSLALMIGCTNSTPPTNSTAEVGGMVRRRNQGYSLLYQLMSDESDVAKLLMIKSVSPSIADLIKQIATAASMSKKQLDDFAKADAQLHFDVPDLPNIEQSSRELAAKEETKTLLSSSGPALELRLLFTQAQALGYAHQLAAALAAIEENPTRKAYLEGLSKTCADLQQRVLGHLVAKP